MKPWIHALAIFVSCTAFASPSEYDRLYPASIEFCGASQISKKSGFGLDVQGGIGGHGVLYLQGACRDSSAPYPRITLCTEGGVGVSVNSDYRNVNWIAVSDKEFFLNGDLAPQERLTRETYLRAQNKARAEDILRGVEFHPELFATAPAGMSHEEFMFEDTMATDYAIRFGRNLHCARIPVTRAMLSRAVDFLNSLNEKYRSQDYEWSGIYDNCTHTTHNALAAAGIWSEDETNQFIAVQAFNLAIPSNDFVSLMDRANPSRLEDLASLYLDRHARRTLLEEGWLPIQPGAMAEILPIVADNDLYNQDLGALLLDFPLIQPEQLRLNHYSSDPQYLDIRANLEFYLNRYLAVKNSKKPSWIYETRLKPHESYRPEEFERFYARFYEWLDRQIADTQTKLARL